ncbi:MAG: DUF1612 domain-containing protein, partial [Mesorhizobium sp.]
LLRERGKVGSYLFAFNVGLRTVPRDRRRARDRTTRLLAVLDAFAEAAAVGLKELDRLVAQDAGLLPGGGIRGQATR